MGWRLQGDQAAGGWSHQEDQAAGSGPHQEGRAGCLQVVEKEQEAAQKEAKLVEKIQTIAKLCIKAALQEKVAASKQSVQDYPGLVIVKQWTLTTGHRYCDFFC